MSALSSSTPFFFFNDTATTEIYTPLYTLSLHDALPIGNSFAIDDDNGVYVVTDAAQYRSEEHTSELQSHSGISYAVFCLTKKKKQSPSRSSRRRWSKPSPRTT